MAVDPALPRKVLVVHGVQTGTDADLDQDQLIDVLIRNRLNGLPVQFSCDLYRYENVNDAAQGQFRSLLKLFVSALSGQQLLSSVSDTAADLVGDVVIALADDSTAADIRAGLRARILEIYEQGHPLYVVAHSLGTIYALDVVNELMEEHDYFDRDSRKTWPVQALITMGSPVGLSMFKRSKVTQLGAGRRFFRWANYWARTDPVVSGSFYGKPQQGYQIAGRFHTSSEQSGWFIQDRVVDIGRVWLLAHTGYWDHAPIGDDLARLITS
jgi:hypothetical protein